LQKLLSRESSFSPEASDTPATPEKSNQNNPDDALGQGWTEIVEVSRPALPWNRQKPQPKPNAIQSPGGKGDHRKATGGKGDRWRNRSDHAVDVTRACALEIEVFVAKVQLHLDAWSLLVVCEVAAKFGELITQARNALAPPDATHGFLFMLNLINNFIISINQFA